MKPKRVNEPKKVFVQFLGDEKPRELGVWKSNFTPPTEPIRQEKRGK